MTEKQAQNSERPADTSVFAEQFARRRRPPAWAFAVASATCLIGAACAFASGGGQLPPWFALPIGGAAILSGWWMWHEAIPICPNCRRNITLCRAIYCHICGRQLHNRRCETCCVDDSWLAYFRPIQALKGNASPIRWCPRCGVWLDTRLCRWRR